MREYIAVVDTLLPVLQKGRSLDTSWAPDVTPLAKQIAFGVLRHYFSLGAVIDQLVKKPLPEKHLDIRILLMAGIYSIDAIKRPDYASVNDTVESADKLGKPWAKGMVNGVLRNYLRQREAIALALAANPESRDNHPAWLRAQIIQGWPKDAAAIIAANNTQAPMTLRVNTARTTRDLYKRSLDAVGIKSRPGSLCSDALYLETPVSIDNLPGFQAGCVSVQDEASQLAAELLALKPHLQILDACAAPGGKTCHILEREADISVTALDVSADRLKQVRQNLTRLGLQCKLQATDLREFQPEERFDRILLDAPCSATGIIRRHPDIKLLRRESDIAKLAAAQTELLAAAWQLLAPQGVLVYSTCSILPAENETLIARFLDQHHDAAPWPILGEWGVGTGTGRQLFPVVDGHDGFYYARLVKAGLD